MAILQKKLKALCTPETCRTYDFVVLPTDGDTGFEEYHKYKSQLIQESRFNPVELDPNNYDNKAGIYPLAVKPLILSYPPVDYESKAFDLFFDSPRHVADNMEYKGCFAIDVTAYIGKEDDVHFTDLLSYIHGHPAATYILFVYCDNVSESDRMYNVVSSYNWFRKLSFTLPEPAELTDYTVFMLRDFAAHIENGVAELLTERFESKPTGYDFPDYMHKVLKIRGYDGSCEALKALIAELDDISGSTSTGYGY